MSRMATITSPFPTKIKEMKKKSVIRLVTTGFCLSPDPTDVLGLEEVGGQLSARKAGPQLGRVVVGDRLLVIVNPRPAIIRNLLLEFVILQNQVI